MKELLQKIVNCNNVPYAKSLLDACIKSPKIEKAYEFSIKAHEGQYRKSGEEYVVHPILVAT
ncbi:MAG: hypothetical protein ACQESH_02265, partial [Campylobacterota bacterium]